MARPLRIEFSGACYHVINRGNYRRALFNAAGAAEAFERALDEAAIRFHWQIHAYVVMSTHFHLALELTEPNLSEGMRWLQGTWIRRFNAFRRLVGRPFQGRYKALLVAPGHALAQVCHYIHLNPVRAGVVPAKELLSYAASSLPKWVSGPRTAWLVPDTVLSEAGGLPDTPEGWQRYLHYLEFLATDATAQRDLVARRMSRGWCIGDRSFREDMKRLAAEKGAELDAFAGLEPEAVRAERAQAWEERLQALALAAKIDLPALPAKKSHPDKALLAAALKASSSASNRWLAQRLGMGEPASASQFARRWMLRSEGAEAVRRLVEDTKEKMKTER